MRLDLFDYILPKNLIAQRQIKPRDSSRLMVVSKQTKRIKHDFFYNLDKYLDKDDVLVFNNSKVFPARIKFAKNGEIFLLKELNKGEWEIMGKKLNNLEGQELGNGLKCKVLRQLGNGNWVAKFNYSGKKFRDILNKIGQTPLPPYIKTKDSKKTRNDYQTIYAKDEGSVAAPTAGLHFTKRVFNKLKKKGIKVEFVTLHVGLGTFQSVKTDEIEKHKMHAEYVILDKAIAERLNGYKKDGRRIVAVGTTSARALEAMADKKNQLRAGSEWVNIFIYPSYKFKFVNALITNFHLPKSTLLILVAALTGRKFILKIYKEAIKKKYRFYSFGDGMLIS